MKTQFYQHVERLDSDEVDGILDGEVYIYTKLDGTNAGVHYNNGKVIVNSRKRELSEGKIMLVVWIMYCLNQNSSSSSKSFQISTFMENFS